jgi:hypothetical protein
VFGSMPMSGSPIGDSLASKENKTALILEGIDYALLNAAK